MARLAITLIDVGWGDSIFVESENGGQKRFALVDCNDYENERSSLIFVKRFLHRSNIAFEDIQHNFEWVLLSHGHADHARGLKRMLKTFGTRNFWYPKSVASTTFGNLLNYANRSSNVDHHQAIDETKILDPTVNFGNVSLSVLWPNYDQIDSNNENNNSVVLALTLGQVAFVLTGDAEAPNWTTIAPRLPANVEVFQVPHHGARNGMFDAAGGTPWLDSLPAAVRLAMSSHIRPHGHPHGDVVAEVQNRNFTAFRTDRQYHVTFSTDGTRVEVQYSHV